MRELTLEWPDAGSEPTAVSDVLANQTLIVLRLSL
jgi:hypothetical protein